MKFPVVASTKTIAVVVFGLGIVGKLGGGSRPPGRASEEAPRIRIVTARA